MEKFTSIFEEVSWALAAHVNWHNNDVSGKEPFQIDLFCTETANLMAEMLDLFGALVRPRSMPASGSAYALTSSRITSTTSTAFIGLRSPIIGTRFVTRA